METPNVILITIDSLRVDHLGCYGYPRDTTPNIDNLASKGALFLEAISNGGQTASAFPSILASLPPPLGRKWGKTALRPLRRSTTLAEVLKGVAYRTAAFHSNPFLSHFYGYDRGFDIFNDSLDEHSLRRGQVWMMTKARASRGLIAKALTKLGKIKIVQLVFARVMRGPIVTAEEITNKVLSWLREHREGLFLWLHYMDTHWPYVPPSKYASKFCNQHVSQHRMSTLNHKHYKNPEQLSSLEVATLVDLYDASIRYVDDNIGRLLDSLGSRLQNTIIIVTADHGEAFGEHGRFYHDFLYDELVHVPLIIAGPGIRAGTIVREPIELMDLAPTVADFVGIDNPPWFHGKSLSPVMNGESMTATGTISTVITKLEQSAVAYRTPDWKYICTESLDEANTVFSEEIYDLRNDSGERHNLHGSENEEARAFELEAVNKILEFKRRKGEEKTAYEKERIKAKLKKLNKQ